MVDVYRLMMNCIVAVYAVYIRLHNHTVFLITLDAELLCIESNKSNKLSTSIYESFFFLAISTSITHTDQEESM